MKAVLGWARVGFAFLKGIYGLVASVGRGFYRGISGKADQ